jgi:anti-sigma regulatory factor (Ser/Thr protein kinase)
VNLPPKAASAVPYISATIVLASDARLLSTVRKAIESLTAELGWNPSESRAITLAVEEALTNKIRHAYNGRTDGRIQFEFSTEPDSLVFRLTDRGEAPDPAKICAREPDSLKPGGFGTNIIRDVMDKVIYQTAEGGNQLILIKYFPHGDLPDGGPS